MKIKNLFLIILFQLINETINQENETIWENYLMSRDYLKASNNQIQSLKGIEKLTSLRRIDLSKNELVNINEFDYFTSVISLNLSNNNIISINSLKNLKMLTNLNLLRNKIVNIDVLQDLRSLRVLDLSFNQIENIDALRNLTFLRLLFLTNNKIYNLEPIQNLKLLLYLYLFQNEKFNQTNYNLITKNQIYSTYYNNSIKNFNQFKQIFIFDENFDYLTNITNTKRTTKYKRYFQAVYLFTINNFYYIDCFKTIDFMKRNYHLNLFFHEQVYHFFHACEYLDLDF